MVECLALRLGCWRTEAERYRNGAHGGMGGSSEAPEPSSQRKRARLRLKVKAGTSGRKGRKAGPERGERGGPCRFRPLVLAASIHSELRQHEVKVRLPDVLLWQYCASSPVTKIPADFSQCRTLWF